MAKYISLIKYTAKGIENVKESPKRLDAFKQLCESMGAKVEGFYLTMGRYDLVVIVEAPNPETAAYHGIRWSSEHRNTSGFFGERISENHLWATIRRHFTMHCTD